MLLYIVILWLLECDSCGLYCKYKLFYQQWLCINCITDIMWGIPTGVSIYQSICNIFLVFALKVLAILYCTVLVKVWQLIAESHISPSVAKKIYSPKSTTVLGRTEQVSAVLCMPVHNNGGTEWTYSLQQNCTVKYGIAHFKYNPKWCISFSTVLYSADSA